MRAVRRITRSISAPSGARPAPPPAGGAGWLHRDVVHQLGDRGADRGPVRRLGVVARLAQRRAAGAASRVASRSAGSPVRRSRQRSAGLPSAVR